MVLLGDISSILIAPATLSDRLANQSICYKTRLGSTIVRKGEIKEEMENQKWLTCP